MIDPYLVVSDLNVLYSACVWFMSMLLPVTVYIAFQMIDQRDVECTLSEMMPMSKCYHVNCMML